MYLYLDRAGAVHQDSNNWYNTFARPVASLLGFRNYDLTKIIPKLDDSQKDFYTEKLMRKFGLGPRIREMIFSLAQGTMSDDIRNKLKPFLWFHLIISTRSFAFCRARSDDLEIPSLRKVFLIILRLVVILSFRRVILIQQYPRFVILFILLYKSTKKRGLIQAPNVK